MAAEFVLGSVRNLRRVSVELHNLAVEDLTAAAAQEGPRAGGWKVLPDAPPLVVPTTASSPHEDSSTPPPATLSPPAQEAKHDADLALPLLDKRTSILRHTAGENFVGIICAIISALVLYPLFRLLEYLSDALDVDRVYSISAMGMINCELLTAAMFGGASISRRLYCVWPLFITLLIVVGLSPAIRSAGDHSVAESAVCFPIVIAVYSLSLSSKYVYSRFKGVKTSSYAKTLVSSVAFAVVTIGTNVTPSFAVLIPARYLAYAHPYWYIVVTGIGFPALTIVLRKSALSYYLRQFRKKVEKGELPVEQVLDKYATISKIVTVCLMLANVVMMYFSDSKSACVLTAMLSVITEIGGKMYVVWFMRKEFSGSIARKKARVRKVLKGGGARKRRTRGERRRRRPGDRNTAIRKGRRGKGRQEDELHGRNVRSALEPGRLPKKKWKELAAESAVLTFSLICVACGLNVTYIIVTGKR